jgi:hypothetical protein
MQSTMRMFKIISLILFVSLTSCKAKQVLVSSRRTDEKLVTGQLDTRITDSTRISERYTDQVITIPGDSLKVSFPLVTNDSGKLIPASIEVKGERSSMKIDVSGNNIQAVARCDEYQAKIQVLERTVETYKTETTNLKQTVESYENEITVLNEEKTGFQKTIIGIKKSIKRGFFIAALLLGLVAALKYAKPILSIIKKLIKWQKPLF